MSIYTQFIPDQYCVYHTTYSGKLLPANYIGSTSVDNVLNQNYHGSVSSKRYIDIWLSELKLHPELFSTVIVSYHDTRSNATYKELQVQRTLNVVKSELFINRSYASINGWCDTAYTPEERSIIKLKEITTKANKTPEQKAITSKKQSNAHTNRTIEQKSKTSKRLSDIQINFHSNKTLEQESETSKKMSDAHTNRTEEERSIIKLKEITTKANKTPEQKLLTSLKMSNAYTNKSDEKKKKHKQNLSNSMKGRTPTPFLSMIHNKKTYSKAHISTHFPELKCYY